MPGEAGALTFGALLRRCADEVSSAAQHQTLPYQMLLKRLGHFDEEDGASVPLGKRSACPILLFHGLLWTAGPLAGSAACALMPARHSCCRTFVDRAAVARRRRVWPARAGRHRSGRAVCVRREHAAGGPSLTAILAPVRPLAQCLAQRGRNRCRPRTMDCIEAWTSRVAAEHWRARVGVWGRLGVGKLPSPC